MILARHAQSEPNDFSKSSQKTENNLSAHKLTFPAIHGHTESVGANHQQTAKFWDSNPDTWRQNRQHDAGGFFTSVECASGFMPGMRGLQDGVTPKQARRVPSERLEYPATLPHLKTQFGAVIMTAITMGNTARSPLATLPTRKAASAQIVFNKSRTGLIAYRKGTPLAWLVLGYHQGQLNNQKKLVKFVDVAYHRQNDHGISMETAFFDTLPEAVAFIRTTFSNGGAA